MARIAVPFDPNADHSATFVFTPRRPPPDPTAWTIVERNRNRNRNRNEPIPAHVLWDWDNGPLPKGYNILTLKNKIEEGLSAMNQHQKRAHQFQTYQDQYSRVTDVGDAILAREMKFIHYENNDSPDKDFGTSLEFMVKHGWIVLLAQPDTETILRAYARATWLWQRLYEGEMPSITKLLGPIPPSPFTPDGKPPTCQRRRFGLISLKMFRNVVKPDTVLFNLLLGSCVRFGYSLKGQELIELMAKVEVIADAYRFVIMSCVYEINGMRDELKKFKEHTGQPGVQI
ncbi:unnamed protein product [Arabis nemorensis]|uniref:Uncharacterized protein n=1 Tax=Arabis nemorensis TaxID=586526 RepID=A0A565CEX5_9BRAS|nr:unnamed protein product [Arabis nemorensis]